MGGRHAGKRRSAVAYLRLGEGVAGVGWGVGAGLSRMQELAPEQERHPPTHSAVEHVACCSLAVSPPPRGVPTNPTSCLPTSALVWKTISTNERRTAGTPGDTHRWNHLQSPRVHTMMFVATSGSPPVIHPNPKGPPARLPHREPGRGDVMGDGDNRCALLRLSAPRGHGDCMAFSLSVGSQESRPARSSRGEDGGEDGGRRTVEREGGREGRALAHSTPALPSSNLEHAKEDGHDLGQTRRGEPGWAQLPALLPVRISCVRMHLSPPPDARWFRAHTHPPRYPDPLLLVVPLHVRPHQDISGRDGCSLCTRAATPRECVGGERRSVRAGCRTRTLRIYQLVLSVRPSPIGRRARNRNP